MSQAKSPLSPNPSSQTTPSPKPRQFDTGATRNPDTEKPDYEGYLSPRVLIRYGEFMTKHRHLADGTLRASDNWQKGIPLEAYMKSGFRHFMDWWSEHREIKTAEGLEEALCALIFNSSGYLHEILKVSQKGNDPSWSPADDWAPSESQPDEERPSTAVTDDYEKKSERRTSQPLLYLSGQLTNGGTKLPYDKPAVDMMNAVGAELLKRGFAVYMPQLTVHFPEADRLGINVAEAHKTWLTMDKTIIRRCDAVVRVLNGPSQGADEEIAYAMSLGIPVLEVGVQYNTDSTTIKFITSRSGSLMLAKNFCHYYPVGKER